MTYFTCAFVILLILWPCNTKDALFASTSAIASHSPAVAGDLSQEHEHSCDISQYNAAINSRSNEDFLPYRDKSNRIDYQKLLLESQSLLRTTVLRIKELNLAKRDSYLSVLLPKYSKCMWLSVSKPDRAGLGHSLFSWAYYLRIAQNLNLTYWSPFYCISHDMCNDLVGNAKYFGLHPTFYWSRRPPSKNTTIIQVYDSQKRNLCQESDILKSMLIYMRDNPNNSNYDCSGSKNVLFQCNNDDVPLNSRLLYSLVDVSIVLNTIFNVSYFNYKANYYGKVNSKTTALTTSSHNDKSKSKSKSIYPPVHSPESFKGRKLFKMVVHMRRGDIIRSENVDIKHRVVSTNVFLQIIKKVLQSRSLLFPSNVNKRQQPPPMPYLDISILCEDSLDSSHVSEFKLLDNRKESHPSGIISGNLHRSSGEIKFIDIKKVLADVCNDDNFCSISVSHKLPFLISFSLMCESDILVSMKSGFSLTAASFCLPPLVIGSGLSPSNFDKFKYFVPIKSKNSSFHDWNTVVDLPNLHDELARVFLSTEALNRFKVKVR